MPQSSFVEGGDYLRFGTIAAGITGPGGAIAGIRISGPEALGVLARLCGEVGRLKESPRKLFRTTLRDLKSAVLDDAIAVYFEEGSSFTGEATVEIFTHGGALIRQEVLENLIQAGAKAALPGEFSFRAVRNGKMTLDQAEAIRDLIESTNRRAHGLAIERLGGSAARVFSTHAERLRQALTLAEAGIDFSDQDLDETALSRLKLPVGQVIGFLEALEQTLERGRKIQEGVRVALAGLPNAGKSSLFNELLGADRSLISEEAGTTRDVIREQVRLRWNQGASGELSVWLYDTAGLREGAGQVERQGIERAIEAAQEADLMLFIVDPGSESELVSQEWARLGAPQGRALVVLHKADLWGDPLQRSSRESQWRALLGVSEMIWVSSQTHEGVDTLVARLGQRCGTLTQVGDGELILTRMEQQDAVRRAREALGRAMGCLEHDLFASDLRSALDHLSFFIGKTRADDILGRIFSQFCIGK